MWELLAARAMSHSVVVSLMSSSMLDCLGVKGQSWSYPSYSLYWSCHCLWSCIDVRIVSSCTIMVDSWWEVCISSLFCLVASASSCIIDVVNHMPCDNVKFDRLSKSFAAWAVMLVCRLWFVCAAGIGLSDCAVVMTVVGGCVPVVKLYNRKSLSACPMRLLLACNTQLLAGSHCHVTCWWMVSLVNVVVTFWAWSCPNVGLRIHLVNGKRCQTALQPC